MPGFSGFPLPPDTALPVQQHSFIGDLSKQLFSTSNNNSGMNSLLTMMRFMQARQNAAILAQNRAIDQQLKLAKWQNELFKQKYGYTAKEQQSNIALEKQNLAANELANNPDFIDMYRGALDASTVRRDKIFKDLRDKFIEPITKSGPYAGADPYAIEEALLGPDKRRLENDKKAINNVSWLGRTWDRIRQGGNTALGYAENLFSDKSPDQIARETQEANKAITQANPALLEDERRAAEGEGWYDRGDWFSHAAGEAPALAAYGGPAIAGARIGGMFGPAGAAVGGLAGLIASALYGGSQGSVDYSTSILNSGMPAADQQAALNNAGARNLAKGVGAGVGFIPMGGRWAVKGLESAATRMGLGSTGRAVAAVGSKEGQAAVLQQAKNRALYEEAQRGLASSAGRGAFASGLEFSVMGGAGTYGANTAYNAAAPEQYRVDPATGVKDAALSGAFTGVLLGAGHGAASKVVSSKLTSRDADTIAKYTPEGTEREPLEVIARDYRATDANTDPSPFVNRLYNSYHDDAGAFNRFAKAANLSAEERGIWNTLYRYAGDPDEQQRHYESLLKAAAEKKAKGIKLTAKEQRDIAKAKLAAEKARQEQEQAQQEAAGVEQPSPVDTSTAVDNYIAHVENDFGNTISELDRLVSIVKADRETTELSRIKDTFADDEKLGKKISGLVTVADAVRTSPFVERLYDGIKNLSKDKISDVEIRNEYNKLLDNARADNIVPSILEVDIASKLARYYKRSKEGSINKIMNGLINKLSEIRKNLENPTKTKTAEETTKQTTETKTAEETTKQTAEETTKQTAEETTKQTTEETTKQTAEETTKQTTEETTKQTTETKTAEETTKQTAEAKTAEAKTAEETTKQTAEETTKQTAEAKTAEETTKQTAEDFQQPDRFYDNFNNEETWSSPFQSSLDRFFDYLDDKGIWNSPVEETPAGATTQRKKPATNKGTPRKKPSATKAKKGKKNAEESVSPDGQKRSAGAADAGNTTGSAVAAVKQIINDGVATAGDENPAGSSGANKSTRARRAKAPDVGQDEVYPPAAEKQGKGRGKGKTGSAEGDTAGNSEPDGGAGNTAPKGKRGAGNDKQSKSSGRGRKAKRNADVDLAARVKALMVRLSIDTSRDQKLVDVFNELSDKSESYWLGSDNIITKRIVSAELQYADLLARAEGRHADYKHWTKAISENYIQALINNGKAPDQAAEIVRNATAEFTKSFMNLRSINKFNKSKSDKTIC